MLKRIRLVLGDLLFKSLLLIAVAGTEVCQAAAPSPLAPPGDESKVVFVEIASSKVRTNPQHWAPGVADVKYGAALNVIAIQDAWLRVKTSSGIEGFIHKTAVTNRKIVLAAGSSTVQIRADESDVVLAGKGFNQEMEYEYSGQNKDLDYKEVDAVEKVRSTDDEIGNFVSAGKLRERY